MWEYYFLINCFLKVLVPKLPELMGKMFKVRFKKLFLKKIPSLHYVENSKRGFYHLIQAFNSLINS